MVHYYEETWRFKRRYVSYVNSINGYIARGCGGGCWLVGRKGGVRRVQSVGREHLGGFYQLSNLLGSKQLQWE